MRPPIPYFGGKQRIAEQVVSLFPEHDHYVEPYCGGLSIYLAKPPSKIETLNDLDHSLMTFWRVLRDTPEDLVRACVLTPHGRAELAVAREPMDGLPDLEIARRVWVQLAQGRAGRRTRTGLRFYLDGSTTASPMARYLASYVERMPPAAARLAGAQLECRDALSVITDYGRAETTLLYVDPPYLGESRRGAQYIHEMESPQQHEALAEALRGVRAKVALSGYASDLYDRLYPDWEQTHIYATTEQGNLKGKPNARVEVVWTNFQPQPHLFSTEAS